MAIRQFSDEQLDKMMEAFAFPEYSELLEMREIVDDCLAGQKTIKEKTKYLPPTKWQEAHADKYHEFLRRALFPGETKASLDIYEGLFHLGTPQVELPSDGRMNYLIDDASVYRDGLKDIQVRLNKEQMAHGLRLMLLEVRDDPGRPFFIQEYGANKFLRSHFTDKFISGESVADAVLLNESSIENDITSWSFQKVRRLRLLGLDKNMEYYQRSVSPEELYSIDVSAPPQDKRTVYPAFQGVRYNRIPISWCGASSLSGVTFDVPPLLSIAETELKLYLCMAHNSQHIFMNTQESIVITGAAQSFKLKNDEFVAGSVVVIPGEHAQAKYLSTNGIGFEAEEKEINRLLNAIHEKRLSLMSAKSHQSGTVVGMVQNSQSAPLRTIVSVSGNAITQILKHSARWMGYGADDVNRIAYIPSEQFASAKVNMSEFIALCKSVNAGETKMLEKDLYAMAKESGFISSRLSWEEFKARYDIEAEERLRNQSVIVTSNGNPFAGAEGNNVTGN